MFQKCILFKNIKLMVYNDFNVLILKIKKYYFNIKISLKYTLHTQSTLPREKKRERVIWDRFQKKVNAALIFKDIVSFTDSFTHQYIDENKLCLKSKHQR
jgi:hypothetical protein